MFEKFRADLRNFLVTVTVSDPSLIDEHLVTEPSITKTHTYMRTL